MRLTPPIDAVLDEHRLRVLDRLRLLDTPAEPAFDRLTALATRLTGAPVGLTVLVDRDRQWFKSQVGLPEPWATARETPLSHSFCQHVVSTTSPLIVEDAREDAVLKDNLAIRDLGVIAYAGMPLVCDGECVGSFCLIDSEPRAWTEEELAILEDLAAAAMSELSLRLALSEQERITAVLTESDARYRSLITAMADGVVLQEADGTILACNIAAEHILGLTADQLSGRSSMDPRWRSVREDGSDFPGDEHPAMVTLRTGQPCRGVIMGVDKPGAGRTWISIASEPLTAPGEDLPHAVVATFTDITAQRAHEAELEIQLREQEALRTVATLVARESDSGAVFGAAAEHAARVLGAVVSSVFRLESNGDVRIVGTWSPPHLPAPQIGDALDVDGPSASALALRTRRAAEVSKYETPPILIDGAEAIPIHSGLAAPIEVGGRLWGVLSIGREEMAPEDPESMARLTRLADIVSLAVSGAESREQMKRLASTDHLTGLANQRTFSKRLDDEFGRAKRYRRPLSVVALDLDHFKNVNDTYGHDVGSRALTEFARRLKEVVRDGELVARVGGEEFAWILPETDGVGALEAGERARRMVADTPFETVGRLTTSVGICSVEDAADAKELFRHADVALYAAKASGRNCTARYRAGGTELADPLITLAANQAPIAGSSNS